ncbi:MAG: ComF family protein [Treponema sp.]|nr:ComF family protein [Candidatus Treponema equifaecale]
MCKRCLTWMLLGTENSQSCRICGKTLVSEIELCSSCRESPVIKSCDGVYPLYSYRLWKKNLLFSWKMLEKRNLSSIFSKLVYARLNELQKTLGTNLSVVPVPPRPGKIRDRGWDQIDELCRYLHRGWNVKVLKLLRRNSVTQQKKLDRVQRLETIGNAYSLVSQKRLKKIEIPETVVLVDDVLTTGSTIENCAALLKSLGVKRVLAITLFVVD